MNCSSRRDILKLAGLAALGTGAARAQSSMADVKFEAKATVRLGVIGVGGRGNSLIDNFSAVPGVEIGALCDVVDEKTQAGAGEAGQGGEGLAAHRAL